jgi:hypothetical protein
MHILYFQVVRKLTLKTILTKHDILFCVETNLDELEVINLPDGYSYHCKNRKKNAKRSLVV